MVQKSAAFKTKGMNRDLSVSAFNSDFSFENKNLRLATNDDNTMLSWVNEKGPAIIVGEDNESIVLKGTPVGTAVIDHQLVVFTTEEEGLKPDHIYVLQYTSNEGTTMTVLELYNGNLNFSVKHPFETLVYYESPEIEKVYWTDGYNQPRLINIKAAEDKVALWNSNDKGTVDTWFDFVPAIGLKERLTVKKNVSGGGLFMPGVIQYCFTYLNKYGQQSNVVAVSPLYYLAHNDRGGKPNEHISNSFTITIDNVDTSFDYVRLYSIQRTALDTTAGVKLIEDLSIKGGQKNEDGSVSVSYTDNGTTGSASDPMEVLYAGGKEISAYTMAMKDNTLFLGNMVEKHTLVAKIQECLKSKENRATLGLEIKFSNDEEMFSGKVLQYDSVRGVYANTNTLKKSRDEITTFKGGETYRFGIQLQKNTGEWLDPIFICDKENRLYPRTYLMQDKACLVYAYAHLNIKSLEEMVNDGNDSPVDFSVFKRVRPLIVYPNVGNRTVLCQGVVNPTVFNVEDRVTSSPFSQASWFFRPYLWNTKTTMAPAVVVPVDIVDIYESITETKQEVVIDSGSGEYPIITVPDYFKDKVSNAGVLVAKVQRDKVASILTRGTLVGTLYEKDTPAPGLERNTVTELNQQFLGAVCLDAATDNPSANPTYAFIRYNTTFRHEGYDETKDSGGHITHISRFNYSSEIQDVEMTTQLFPLYNRMKTEEGLLYYERPAGSENESSADSFTFKFYITTSTEEQDKESYDYYEITFAALGVEDVEEVEHSLNSNSSRLEFGHYKSIFAASRIPIIEKEVNDKPYEEVSTDSLIAARQIEIQGSKDIYTNDSGPYDALKTDRQAVSNTQYFVDHSIVTLNSPDIDFDTEVQNYSTDNLKLRIVGAIPLTSGVSSHSILNSSAMVEVNYNHHKNSIMTGKSAFGVGELNRNVTYKNVSVNAGWRLVSDYMWDDVVISSSTDGDDNDTPVVSLGFLADYMVYPWQRTGSLNNDRRGKADASSLLESKVEAYLSYSKATKYFNYSEHFNFHDYLSNLSDEEQGLPDLNTLLNFDSTSVAITLTENSEVMNYRLPAQNEDMHDINYYANIEKVLVNTDGYKVFAINANSANRNPSLFNVVNNASDSDNENGFFLNSPVSMKYKSTSHAVIAFNAVGGTGDDKYDIPLLPYGTMNYNSKKINTGLYTAPESFTTTFWGDSNVRFKKQLGINVGELLRSHNNDCTLVDPNESERPFSYLWIGEMYKEVSNRFGGTTDSALAANSWLVGGNSVDIVLDSDGNLPDDIELVWTEGDTYYQRYDCLKTYPFTKEDPNQLVEILSFMCETHVNLDGRYDQNRGQMDNTYVGPDNFNLLNTAYSQKDNFFQYNKIDIDEEIGLSYPNQAYYSKTKTSGADVDLFTNVTLGSTMEFDGDKGKLNAIRRLNNNLVAFQDTGISQILYNEQVQISTENGVPIEIANSGKVQGTRYLSDTIGCSNKWAMATTPSGIYFMDNVDKSIYMLGGEGLRNLTGNNGMNVWAKQVIPSSKVEWNPKDFNNFVAYYDSQNQDILFINKDTALAYSEKTGTFTSFYDYGNTPYFNNLDGTGVWLRKNEGNTNVYRHNAGEYCNFFGEKKPYWMTLVGNPEPQLDKIFTNLEFRASVDGEVRTDNGKEKFLLPFDCLEAWDEYQHGTTKLSERQGNGVFQHHIKWNADTGDISNISRKFRMWRCDIPRDNAPVPDSLGLPRVKARYMDRLRNPWIYMKLMKNADESMNRVEVHDVMLKYFG